jgi:predicted metal-dependent phosphoesterase TrpH
VICDFHVHSTASDGSLMPIEVAEEARRRNIDCLALTDHDSIGGIAAAAERGRQLGVEVMAGIEISVCEDEGRRQMHILGLGIDPEHPGLRDALLGVRENRLARAERIIDLLRRSGVALELSRVHTVAGDAPLSRPHIASALVENGACRDPDDAFSRYLRRGRPAFVPADGLTSRRAIELIHSAGGMASLAHPPLSIGVDQPGGMDAFVGRLVRLGLDGIEIQHPSHTSGQRRKLRRLARSCHLVPTGGSDFHGSTSPGIVLGTGRAGNVSVGAEAYRAIRARSAAYRERPE